MILPSVALLLSVYFIGAHGFVCKLPRKLRVRGLELQGQKDSSGQGFGKKKAASKAESARNVEELKGMNIMGSAIDGDEKGVGTSTEMASSGEANDSLRTSSGPVDLNDAIESSKLFKSTRARQEALLDEKIARLREEEEMLATDPSVGAVPEMVADRMIGRIAAFFGVPVFGGLAIFVGAFFYSKQTDTVIQPNIIAYATQVPFVLGLLGITYGIMSASWEPESEGSALGIDEFKTNFARVKDGLKRTRENAELKDEVERESKKLGR